MSPRTVPLPERLARRSIEQGECLVWQGSTDAFGYGLINVDGKTRKVHRVAYEATHGPVPEGLILRHTCDNPPCWRDEHIIPGTHMDNTMDMFSRGRQVRPPIKRISGEGSEALRFLGVELRVRHVEWIDRTAAEVGTLSRAVYLRGLFDRLMAGTDGGEE